MTKAVEPRYSIRELREARGLTHRALATAARMTQAQISTFEHGTWLPLPGTLSKIASALHVDVEQIAIYPIFSIGHESVDLSRSQAAS